MGGIGDPDYAARNPAVAYDVGANEYLVVWEGDDNVGGLVQGENEIFGQRLDAATGMSCGANDFRISEMGGTGDASYNAAVSPRSPPSAPPASTWWSGTGERQHRRAG